MTAATIIGVQIDVGRKRRGHQLNKMSLYIF
jgi:hypothetical protein